MPILSFYNIDPLSLFPTTGLPSSGFVYTGPASPTGSVDITDNSTGTGVDEFTDDNSGEGSTTGIVTLNGSTAGSANVDNEMSWTVTDSVTGETFQIAQLDVEGGTHAGEYLLSEQPLIAGRAYTIESYDSFPQEGEASVFTYADYVESDGIVSGTAGADTIDVDYTDDPENDLIDYVTEPVDLNLSWVDDMGGDEADVEGANPAVDVGGINVTVTVTDHGGLDAATVEDDDLQYVAAGEPFETNSALFLDGGGDTQSSTTAIDFESVAGSGFEDAVQNVQFRLNDVDIGAWTDIVTIRAYDANGNLLTDPNAVILTPAGDDTVSGDTVTGVGSDDHDEIGGSVLVQIVGPVSRVEIDYDNSSNANQWLWVTDIHFQAVPEGSYDDSVEAGAGDDTIDAGLGADTVYGEGGDDTILVGSGDTAFGDFSEGDGAGNNDGDDTFIINPDQLTGDGEAITIHGGEALDDSDFDTLDFNGQLLAGSIIYSETDHTAGGLSGTAELLDGTIVTFTGIEEIICFASATNILTDTGEVAIEHLTPGQMISTLDHGYQPLRWIGSRTVPAQGRMAPIVIRAGVLGNKRDLRVSPQHRMLIRGAQAQLLFGEDEVLVAAKHLSNWDGVFTDTGGEVEYFHMMFDGHQIVFADGAESESFHPGTVGMGALEEAARDEVLGLFPELATDLGAYGPTVRMCLKQYEAQLLAM